MELVRDALSQADRVESELNAFITRLPAESIVDAQDREKEIANGHYRGPLHGMPIAIKDNIATKGVRTTAGSKVLRQFVPGADAAVVSLLRGAGAVLVGKTNMHEFGMGGTTINPHYGTSRNPWNTSHIAGGSSGGSGVAVAARECMGALGTDTGGSVRVPAAVNGVTGIRPTYGLVSTRGVVPLAWSADTVGPLCKSALDCALLLHVMSGDDHASGGVPHSIDLSGEVKPELPDVSIGIVVDYPFSRVAGDISAVFDKAVDQLVELGARRGSVRIPHLEHNDAAQAIVEMSEGRAYHEAWFREKRDDYGDDVVALLDAADHLKASDYVNAQRYRSLLRKELLDALSHVDLIVSPMLPCSTPSLDAKSVTVSGETLELSEALFQFANVAGLAGLPAVCMPCGFSGHGLPVGLQMIGRAFADGFLLRVAAAYQSVTDWHRRPPPCV